jgi:imidazolonepropionase-like amidohydrolase
MKRLASACCFALLLAACGSSSPHTPVPVPEGSGPDVTAFVGATVLTMEPKLEAGARLEEQTVLVRGGHIVVVGPSSRVRVPEGAKTIDARGKFLLPGLIDAHVHLAHAEELPLYVARGVTTVRNMWGAPIHGAWRSEVMQGSRVGPDIRTVGPILDGKDPAHPGSFVALTESDGERAVQLNGASGYDFVKVYSKLEPAVFERIVATARQRKTKVVGHVPREVGLLRALDTGMFTIEHTNTYYDALQADDSPVLGKTDRASRKLWVDHLDTAKMPTIAEHFRAAGAWACPTRVVLRSWEPREAQLVQLARPEVQRFVLPSERAIWQPGEDPPEAERKRNARELEVADTIVRELHQRGVGIVAGTDVGNPLVVPGFALHDELAELVRIGLSPYAALRAATHDAAIVLGMEKEIGTVEILKRADLVLIDGDPLRDIGATTRIAGVMVRGRWIDAAEGERLMAGVETWAEGESDPFSSRPELDVPGEASFRRTFRVSWKGVPFDTERMAIGGTRGERFIRAETFDPHEGALRELRWDARTSTLELAGDGATGRGRVRITRPEPTRLHVEGTLLSGDAVGGQDIAIESDAIVVPDRFLAAYALLPLHERRDMKVVLISLGSTVSAEPATWSVSGTDASWVAITTGKNESRLVQTDAGGHPTGLDMKSHGGRLSWNAMP